jgi:hypothetical protein
MTEAICSALAERQPLVAVLQRIEAIPEIVERAFLEAKPADFLSPLSLESFIVYPFIRLFGGDCRVRCYWINYEKQEYEGLISFGMPTGDFTGKRLPVEEPPYLKVPDTNCWLLHTQSKERTRRGLTFSIGTATP